MKYILKKAFIVLFCLFVSCSIVSAFYSNIRAGADVDEVKIFIEKEYSIGEKVNFPNMDGYKSRTVVSPTGKNYGYNELVLDESGVWTIKYYNDDSVKSYEFSVAVPIFSSTGEKSKTNVGKASSFTNYNAEGKSGIVSKIAVGETVTYNKPINLNDNTINDTLVSLSVLPEVPGTADALFLYVKLTDVWDPENYVKIAVKKVPLDGLWYEHAVYIVCGANGQDGLGLESVTSNAPIYYEGVEYVLHRGYDYFWGTCTPFSLTGVMGAEGIGGQNLVFTCDYEKKRFYADGRLIIDLDDPLFQTNLWDGFKTGECLLSFYAESYNSSYFNLLVNEIDGKKTFNDKNIENEVGPTFVCEEYDLAKIQNLALNSRFNVPKMKAYDVCGNQLNVDVKVYTAYGTGNQADIALINNSFTPTQQRDYYIVYSAIDMWGNEGSAVYKIPALIDVEKISLNLTKTQDEIIVGNEYFVECVEPYNYAGQYQVTVKAVLGDEEIVLGSYSSKDYVENFKFVPMTVGSWKIKYVLSDVFFSGIEKEFLLNVKDGDSVFYDEADVPHYVIKDATYNVPDLYGYTFETGKGVKQKADLYITYDGNISGKQPYSKNEFTIKDNTEFVYLTYLLNGVKKEYKIKVISLAYNTKDQKAEYYFYGYSNIQQQRESFLYTVAKQNDNTYYLDFINAVQSYNFAFNFEIPQGVTYSGVSVYLTDAYDGKNQIKLSLYSIDGKLYYAINDGFKYSLNKEFNSSIKITYSSETNKLFINSKENLIDTNLIGESWKGFEQDMVWVRLSLDEVEGTNTNIGVNKINNQNFYKYTKFRNVDETPEIYQASVSGNRKIGEVLTLPKVVAADVYMTKCVVTFEMLDPNSNHVVSSSGVKLDGSQDASVEYSIDLSMYGSYVVKYIVEDESGSINSLLQYKINIVDVDSPNVTIVNPKTKAFVNDIIEIAKLQIVDDLSKVENCQVSVYIENPNQELMSVSLNNAEKYVFEEAGEYIIWYYVSDQAGNVTLASYFVLVF